MAVALQTGTMLVLLVFIAGTSAQRGGGRGGGGGGGFANTCSIQYPSAANDLVTFASSGETTSNDLKCFMSCVMQARGIMSSTGAISTVGPGAVLPSTLTTAIQPCFALTPSSDVCETAYQHNKCLWEKDPTRGFLRIFQQRGSFTG